MIQRCARANEQANRTNVYGARRMQPRSCDFIHLSSRTEGFLVAPAPLVFSKLAEAALAFLDAPPSPLSLTARRQRVERHAAGSRSHPPLPSVIHSTHAHYRHSAGDT